MSRQTRFGVVLLAIVAGSLAFRLPRLTLRPMHNDEANQAVKTRDLYDDGLYEYDPNEHHGPTLYYLAAAALRLGGAENFAASSEVHFRIVPVLFGVGLVVLLGLAADGLGRAGALCAGLLTAISPAMVYYSRYFIQETLLVFFTLVAIVCGWRYTRTRSPVWLLLAAAGIGLMHATKETCIIAYAAMAVALVSATLLRRYWDGVPIAVRPFLKPRHLILALLVCVLVSVALFSSFGDHWQGPLDSVATYKTYFNRADAKQNVHRHPWDFYFKTLNYWRGEEGLVWPMEGPILGLAVVGLIAAVRRRKVAEADPSLIRFIAFYTLFMTLVYCAIPYKTPWSMLGFLHGMILLAGYGAVALVRGARNPLMGGLVGLGLLAPAWFLGMNAYEANYEQYADYQKNPYAYAHSLESVQEMAELIERIAKARPNGHDMVIKVFSPDYWPLPWYLRRFRHVGYWKDKPPRNPEAAVVITKLEWMPKLDAALGGRYRWRLFRLRPDVSLFLGAPYEYWPTPRAEASPGVHIRPSE